MTMEQSFCLIKPDATERNITGEICAMIEQKGLRIIAQKRLWLTKEQAEVFYATHKNKEFFAGLIDYISSGPVVAQVLEGVNAVSVYRELMGATDPKNADEGSIRKKYGLTERRNSVHGADSLENAKKEIGLFFSGMEIIG